MMKEIISILINSPMVMYVLLFVVGVCIGSFLNVCIYRLPREESIVSPRSKCPHCGKMIRWYDNIPILSWVFLRGECRDCGGSIAIRYPIIEGLTGVMFVLCWYALTPMVALVGMVMTSIFIVATFIDLDHLMIPDRFTVGGFVLGVVFAFFVPELHVGRIGGGFLLNGISSVTLSIVGGVVGAGLLLWIAVMTEVFFKRETMGMGDIKLMGCIGAFCGWEGAVFSIFGGSVLGVIILMPLMLFGKLRNREKGESFMVVPFGPWLSLGAVIYYVWLSKYVDSYFHVVKQVIFWNI